VACTKHGVPTKGPDTQASELSVSAPIHSATSPVVAEVDAGPPLPSMFPPPPFHIIARSEARIDIEWESGEYWIDASIGGNTTFIVFPDFGAVAEKPLLTSIVSSDGACRPSRALSAGFPSLGPINLNLEPDRLFGFVHLYGSQPPPEGDRLLGDFHVDHVGNGWAVIRRGESPSREGPPNERTIGASDLYERKAGGRWRRTAGTNKLGVTWTHAAPFGQGLLVVERVDEKGLDPHCSIQAFGKISRPTPKLSEPNATCLDRIQVFRTFSSGEVLAVGVSSNATLMMERWGAGEQTSTLQTMDTIVPRPDFWAGRNVLPFEVENPSVIRVRTEQGNLVELRFAGGTWKASPLPEGTELAVEHALRIFRPYAPDIDMQNIERREDATYVWVLDKRVPDAHKNLLLRDIPSPAICDVPINPPMRGSPKPKAKVP